MTKRIAVMKAYFEKKFPGYVFIINTDDLGLYGCKTLGAKITVENRPIGKHRGYPVKLAQWGSYVRISGNMDKIDVLKEEATKLVKFIQKALEKKRWWSLIDGKRVYYKFWRVKPSINF